MTSKEIRKKYGKDPMFNLLDNHLWVSLKGLSRKEKDNTGYILSELKKMGFEVTFNSSTKPNSSKHKKIKP